MQSIAGHFDDGAKYETDQLVVYADRKCISIETFVEAALKQRCKSLVYDKKVLDVGCGFGDWCYFAAQCGAKTIDGLDIQEGMVELAKQATSDLDKVHIQVGDASNLPYDDASFDVVTSFFVSCNLPPEAFKKQFQELYRVLVPGGKAIFVIPSDYSSSRLYTRMGDDPAVVENEIAQIVAKIPRHPTTAQVIEAFKPCNSLLYCCFALNDTGNVFRVKNINQLTHGQPVWKHTDLIIFPNYHYSDQSNIMQMLESGFHIDSIENHFTEDKRVTYNSKNPKIPFIKKFVNEPTSLAYYVSKPGDDEPPY